MADLYYPEADLSIDESMVLWRGRLVFRQYIKNKKHKYGVKLYELCESSGIVMKIRVYKGKSERPPPGVLHSTEVILNLMEDATPYEVWTGKKPNLSHVRIFGCPAMVLIPKENRTKLDVKSHKTLDSPPVSNITLRPLSRRMRRHNNDENDIHPSSLMCQNVELTINLLNSDPQSLQEALNSEKADE
ncbi:PiggyBac transposable element-derived protein 4 [Eumeta japonica]|uniref:PiggyBac transposable element-derived protein 4 n=1 Tax=Eumeta variegata TaxID=151549 RepID=A0A4C1ZWZ7_EUMVA|nr:PiggyBac transposable element-derived protein 4 [Eumeta japonica]